MNEYDSGRMSDMLVSMGLRQEDNPEKADLLILNTCAVREKAAEKVFHQLGRWKDLKKTNPALIIAVGGCVASEEGRNVRRRAPYTDIVFGPQTMHKLPEMIKKVEEGLGPQIDISFPANEKFDHLPANGSTSASAFVTIMEGCDNFCTYCIVPYTRGRENSRPVADIIEEIKTVVGKGAKEINLLGQNVNSYAGINKDGQVCSFAELLYEVASVEGIERLRFTTSNPMNFTDEIISAFGDLPILADALHLPVQSGSARILNLMNRHYTPDEYREMIAKLRSVRPNISITSDFIVGFPGETDEDFAETMRLVDDIRFDGSFSFMYSKRPGTKATDMDDQVAADVKSERLSALQQKLNSMQQEYSRRMLNSIQKILVTGPSVSGETLCGRTENNRIVNFRGPLSTIGKIITVRITDVLPHSLLGEMAD